MADAYSISPSSISSTFFQYSSSITSSSIRNQILAIFIGSSIFMFIILTMILCFMGCINKRTKKRHNLSMIKTNGTNNLDSMALANGKHSLTSLPIKTKNFHNGNSLKYRYQSLMSTVKKKPVNVLSSSNSHSSSSIDSTTRVNTAHNRAMTNIYTYMALSIKDDLMPVEFDENINSDMDDNEIELRMTTV